MGNQPPNCMYHDMQPIRYYCTRCREFGCDFCDHGGHYELWSLDYTITLWTAELDSSLGVIQNSVYAFNSINESISSMRKNLHQLYYGKDKRKFYDAFEELVPFICHHAILMRHSLESLTNYAMYIKRFLHDPPRENMKNVINLWFYWKDTERNAEINNDIQHFMVKLYELDQVILSKADSLVVQKLKAIKFWLIGTSYMLMYKYMAILCSVGADKEKLGLAAYVHMPIMKVIFKYVHVSPVAAYMTKLLVHGSLYMCGGNPVIGPSDAFLSIPLIRNEFPELVKKKSILPYIYEPTMIQVMNRFILIIGGEAYETKSRKLMCYDVLHDKWAEFPGIPHATDSLTFCVAFERFIYYELKEKVHVLDLLNTAAGWEEALPCKANKHFKYQTKDGDQFGDMFDRKYMGKGNFEIGCHGNVYRKNMEKIGILKVYNSLLAECKDRYFSVI
eukprot:TRINITY_DN339_c0_g2_i7.p1 TRINITY_DN339_c0_g2~~TRINITY_DN339_c0_g2_i7.p1  ORF type:complete len:447 (-),score=116.68 TRINITY_DN339_c0_g2_i7:171-1511(-)